MFSYSQITRWGCFVQKRLHFKTSEGSVYNFRVKKHNSSLNCLQKLFWAKIRISHSEIAIVNIGSLAKHLDVTPSFIRHLISTKSKKLEQIIAICQKMSQLSKCLNVNLQKALSIDEEIESRRPALLERAKKGEAIVEHLRNRHLLAHLNPKTGGVDFYLSLKKPVGKGAFRSVYPLMNIQTYQIRRAFSIQKLDPANRMEREFRFLKALQNVSQVVKTYFYCKNEEGFYLVTKLCKGTFDQLPQKKKLQLFMETLKGVAHIHREGIIHRDLKPQNILFDEKLKIKIIDFNLSCLASDSHRLRLFCGTSRYMPPEVIFRKIKKEPEKIDAWSLGIILYQICENQFPSFTRLFKKDPEVSEAELIKKIKKIRFSTLKTNSPLIGVIKGLLNPDPLKRLSVTEAYSSLFKLSLANSL